MRATLRVRLSGAYSGDGGRASDATRAAREARDSQGEEGQSLLEMVVSLALLAAVIALFAQSFVAGTASSGYARIQRGCRQPCELGNRRHESGKPRFFASNRHMSDQ